MHGSGGVNRAQIEDTAAHLLVRLWSDPAPSETAAIYAWVDADPAHAVAFARAEAVWHQAGRIKASARASSCGAMQDDAADANAASDTASVIGTARQRNFMIGGIVAASLLLASSAPSTADAVRYPLLASRCPASPTP